MFAMPSDRNLLFGILALQMNFITRDALIKGMHAWVMEKHRPLGGILVEQKTLPQDLHDVLEVMVQKHVEVHGNDPRQSLATVSSVASIRQDLGQIVDPDVQASVCHVGMSRKDNDLSRQTVATFAPGSSRGVRYRRLRPHARGGLGEVFVALDEELNREVALKEIQNAFADDDDSRSRFMLEAEVTGKLEHPGIVPVYGLGRYDDGRPFYAMRFIQGDSLKDAIGQFHKAEAPGRSRSEHALALRGLLGRFVDVCNAVAYAHARGVLHRDLKPGNVMLGRYGETLVVDWGLAKSVERPEESPSMAERTLKPSTASGSSPTQMGSALGTPQYMAPEQAAGRLNELGPACDVYSLGATLYCLLTGKAPFEPAAVGVVLQKVQAGDFPPPRQVKRSVPPALEAICLKAMSLRPQDRYASPRALADDIEHWMGDEPVAVYREPVQARLSRWGRQHKAQVTGVAVLLVTTVIALATGLIVLGQKQAEVVRERNAAQKASAHAEAISNFYENHVLAAARPKGWAGGAGKDVTLKEALDQASPRIDNAFLSQPEVAAAVRNTLGLTYWYLGRFEAANSHLEKAYQIRLEQVGLDHPDTLSSLHNLAMQRWKQDKLDEALPLCRLALETRRRVLGPEHEDTLFSQLNLGLFLFQGEESQIDEAESLLRPAIESCKRTLGADHHHTLYGQNDLAIVLWWKGKTEEAVDLDRQTFKGRCRSLGPEHPDTLRSMGNLACHLIDLGKFGEAELLCRKCLEIKRRVLGPEHLETLWIERYLGDLLGRKGNYVEAEKILRHYLEACRRSVGTNHSETVAARALLGEVLSNAGRPAQAEPLLRECLELREKTLTQGDSRIPYAQILLGQCLTKQGKFAKAETLLLAGHEGLMRVKYSPSRWISQAFDAIIELYEKSGKPQQAEAWQKKRHAYSK